MNRQALYGFLLGVAVLSAVVIWFYMFVMPRAVRDSPSADLPSTPSTTAEPAEPAEAGPDAADPGIATEPPSSKVSPGDTAPLFDQASEGELQAEGTKDEAGSTKRVERIQRIQKELAKLARSGANASPERVSTLLGELREAAGSDEVAGVDIAGLQETVQTATRIRELAEEMSSIAQDPSKEDRARIQEILSEIQRLRQGIPNSASDLKDGTN